MCDVISIENLISNYFVENIEKNEVPLATLSVYKKEIEADFLNKKNRLVYIDNTRSTLRNVATINSDFFSLKSEKISYIRNDHKEGLKREITLYFNAKLPSRVKTDFIEIFSQVNKRYENISNK